MMISHSCNGKAIIFLFSAFIWSIPSAGISRKFIFSILGASSLLLANMLRVAGLYCIYRYLPGWFGFFHHTLFQLLMYALVVLGWSVYLGGFGKQLNGNAKIVKNSRSRFNTNE
jgi:exosortase/archaeosortase family protein